MSRRRCSGNDATITISVGELRSIIEAAVEAGIRRARTRPAPKPKAQADEPWSPAVALHSAGLRVRR